MCFNLAVVLVKMFKGAKELLSKPAVRRLLYNVAELTISIITKKSPKIPTLPK